MRCLLVDDEPGIREGLAMLLRRRGHEVHTAADVAGGLTALRERQPDVVITDWRLPDGDAAAIVAGSSCPVLVASGHPDEVGRHAALRQVLTKPVAPARLLHLLDELAAERPVVPSRPAAADRLPRDVAAVIAELRTAAQDDFEVTDDGTFVTVRGRLPSPSIGAWARAGGDLRRRSDGGVELFELRLCRDGRPDPALVVVAAGEPWPELAEFAVDFHDSGAAIDPAGCLDRSAACRAVGRTVHFLNAPPDLAEWAALHGRSHDMPKREPIGPRLPADLADLWR
ncbi:MAG: response regulator [Planctomycetes bacterium]|nr:response regulator [Planctomycetota bacterium]